MGGRKNIMLVGRVINLTGHKIRMYDDMTGEIFSFYSTGNYLSLLQKYGGHNNCLVNDCYDTIYVVRRRDIPKIKASGRSLCDLAIITSTSIGRNNKRIVYLSSADRLDVSVRLYGHRKR